MCFPPEPRTDKPHPPAWLARLSCAPAGLHSLGRKLTAATAGKRSLVSGWFEGLGLSGIWRDQKNRVRFGFPLQLLPLNSSTPGPFPIAAGRHLLQPSAASLPDAAEQPAAQAASSPLCRSAVPTASAQAPHRAATTTPARRVHLLWQPLPPRSRRQQGADWLFLPPFRPREPISTARAAPISAAWAPMQGCPTAAARPSAARWVKAGSALPFSRGRDGLDRLPAFPCRCAALRLTLRQRLDVARASFAATPMLPPPDSTISAR